MKKSHLMLLISGALLISAAQFFMSNTANILLGILMVALPGAILLRLRGSLPRRQAILEGILPGIVFGLIFGTLSIGLMSSTISVQVFGGMLVGVAFVLVFLTLRHCRKP